METPQMNAIQEEDNLSPETAFQTPKLNDSDALSFSLSNMNGVGNTDGMPSQNRTLFASPRPSSLFYSAKEGNNSSSSIIYNPSFSFGENVSINNTANDGSMLKGKSNDHRRQSLKYIPGTKLAPLPPRTRSPVRGISPDAGNGKRSSLTLESPFNFTASTLQPHQQTPPSSAASRTSFRKGHRYKHSSVSMNFFQEPEVKIPLNIAKSLPIPDLSDLTSNLPWPKAHMQLSIVGLQILACLITFQMGHLYSWNNFITLSHFITYDIIGSLVIIFVENLSQFQVWFTGTITFPFGLNRIDVLLSFALAVSLCFVGLDLLFHIVEEFIVLFVEAGNTSTSNHDHNEINEQIPHSHFATANDSQNENITLWYGILVINLVLSTLSLYKTFYANKYSNLKTKNPIITITYTMYLFIYPLLLDLLSSISDYLATLVISILILWHGLTIARWTSTVLLMGFSTTSLSNSALFNNNHNADATTDAGAESKSGKERPTIRPRSMSSLPIATINTKKVATKTGFWNPIASTENPTSIKNMIKDQIERLNEFKSRCILNYDDLIISKVNFTLYVVLIKITMKGGSNDDELMLRLAINKCIQTSIPSCETTIDIDRI
ncbi:Endoplasmic reticulum zinc transporter [Saccharomyces pastorianus]|uniref:Endoplasmic reticulum zinc transporter n=1 Tax=Saccharomyces pastorianus TaxID=27292 RepID=A0A6C1EFG2_SACPS|nr:Endoplasmic reticulum zinc transporter [Saccharomyces pastorianus]